MTQTKADQLPLHPDDLAYCLNEVRRQDPERFACAMLAPPGYRDALMVLLAFNQEIAKTRDVVSEPTIGLIRLQWWREALDEIAEGTPRRHQVVSPLAAIVGAKQLNMMKLATLIDAREQDLDAVAFSDPERVEHYAAQTNGQFHDVLADAVGVPTEDNDTRTAMRDSAIAAALVGMVRAIPFGDPRFTSATSSHDDQETALNPSEKERKRVREAVRPIAIALVEKAKKKLQAVSDARLDRERMPDGATALLSQNALTRIHLQRLLSSDVDPFDISVQSPISFAGIRLAWTKMRKRF